MKKLILLLMLGSLFAQNLPPQSEIDKMPTSEKMLLYNMNKKNPSTAIIFSLLIPSTGHAYVGKWEKGLLITGVSFSSIIAGIVLAQEDRQSSVRDFGVYMLFGLAVGLRIWEVIDAEKEVNKYNNRVYKTIYGKEPPSFSLNLQPTYKGANLSMTYSFK